MPPLPDGVERQRHEAEPPPQVEAVQRLLQQVEVHRRRVEVLRPPVAAQPQRREEVQPQRPEEALLRRPVERQRREEEHRRPEGEAVLRVHHSRNLRVNSQTIL